VESFRTLDAARKAKRARETARDTGELHEQSRVSFREFAEEWVGRHYGRRGFRESTRDDYRRDLRRYAFPFFDERLGRTVSQVTPRDVANFVAYLCEERDGKRLADASVRRILAPVRSLFATAVREGLVRTTRRRAPRCRTARRVRDEDGEEVRALTREQLRTVLAVVHPRHRLMFRLLAATGLRVSELIALQWRHLRLDGSEPCVRVRRALAKGRVEPPKSKHGKRDVPLSSALVSELRAWRRETEWPGDEDLVFPSLTGTALNPDNLRPRVLRPAAEEAGAPWAGFHTFRHTCASMLFERGFNVKQVQRWLGHHSPSFTLDAYVHLLDEALPGPLILPSHTAPVGATSTSEVSRTSL